MPRKRIKYVVKTAVAVSSRAIVAAVALGGRVLRAMAYFLGRVGCTALIIIIFYGGKPPALCIAAEYAVGNRATAMVRAAAAAAAVAI